MNWYVKNSDGKIFGPVDEAKLAEWAREGRIDPYGGISSDLKVWRLASLMPELEMDWIIENEPGRFYGPVNRAVIDDLAKTNALSADCRIYRDDHDGAAEKAAAAAQEATEKAMAELKDEAEKAMAEVKAEAEKTMAEKNREIVSLKEAAEVSARTAAESAEKISALEEKIARLTETKRREWEAEVVEPEIISKEEPPALPRSIFRKGGSATFAELERQAQAELARMGAEGAKKFFGFKR